MKWVPFLISLFVTSFCFAQTRWVNPMHAGFPVLQNQGWTSEIGQTYSRLPDRAQALVRKPVWDLSRNSAGLAIHFYTNASQIQIRYQVANANYAMNHMPATGVSGIDLYAVDSDGRWHLATEGFSFKDTITYTFNNLIQSTYHKKGFEYRLLLPLYNTVKWLEIGTPDSAVLQFIPVLAEKPIIVYGTSIAQGACASRPGMAWTNILSRQLDYPVINLGFSGNGPFEKELVDLINEQETCVYIFDCLPNMGNLSSEEIYSRVVNGVKTLRNKHSTPILLTDHVGYVNDETNANTRASWQRMNEAQKKAFHTLLQQGVSNLFYLEKDSIRFPQDGNTDYIHPNDWGMLVYAEAYSKMIRRILKMSKGGLPTTQAVSQRREPGSYEWKTRHENILKDVRKSSPLSVILGNSITHYWYDPPASTRGKDSWEKYMKGYVNLGFGWDRIENVLWRVYHGELDGYNAKKVVLLIGTNNLGPNTDIEILSGLQFLLKQINTRQPAAQLKIMGILPRRGQEQRIGHLNKKIADMAKRIGVVYADAGKYLLLPNGKINESLFTDGLHPNAKGYDQIAATIVQ